MNKQIIFCADGTWNGPAEQESTADIDADRQTDPDLHDGVTNVVKLFVSLAGQVSATSQALQNETEKALSDATGNVRQIAKYLHGVGDYRNPVLKVIGGVFGAGVIARIIRGYTFISRNYSAGDSIHILGFSRGAYTARALAGMIATVGLLDSSKYDPNNAREAYLRGLAAWLRCRGVVFAGHSELSSLLTNIFALAGETVAKMALKDQDLLPSVPITSVAVWDTVGSLGIPSYVKGRRNDFFSFVNTKLSPQVAHGFHAMALDERRLDFPVTRWDKDPRVEEVWFAGAHSDVGGGYPLRESGLSDIALDWMIRKVAAVGVQFTQALTQPAKADHCTDDFHTPWSKPPFNIGAKARVPLPGDVFHPSVQKRWQSLASYKGIWPHGFA